MFEAGTSHLNCSRKRDSWTKMEYYREVRW